MNKLFLVICLAALISGCGGFENEWTKVKVNTTKGDFRVSLYSGGKTVKTWDIQNGYISTESASDGWFFNYKGKLVRISGTVIIEQL